VTNRDLAARLGVSHTTLDRWALGAEPRGVNESTIELAAGETDGANDE